MIILCCFVPIIQTLYYIVGLSIICPYSIGVFLIIAFVYFDIVERVTYSQIVSIYSNPSKAATLKTFPLCFKGCVCYLVVCFESLKESTYETRKNVFYFILKALVFLR